MSDTPGPCGCLWAAGTTICRLHLSAPDLLAALERIAAIDSVGDFEVHQAIDLARAAIAKATRQEEK